MKKTKSVLKAINGDIAVVIDGEVHYISPNDLIVNGESLETLLKTKDKQIIKLNDNLVKVNNKVLTLENYNKIQDGRISDLTKKLKDLETVFENTIKEWLTR